MYAVKMPFHQVLREAAGLVGPGTKRAGGGGRWHPFLPLTGEILILPKRRFFAQRMDVLVEHICRSTDENLVYDTSVFAFSFSASFLRRYCSRRLALYSLRRSS